MEYVTVYVTSKRERIDFLRGHFEKENLDYRINEASGPGKKPDEVNVEVAEKDRGRAREILHETGYLKMDSAHSREKSHRQNKKWVPFFFAGIVLILVLLAVWWFMNFPAD